MTATLKTAAPKTAISGWGMVAASGCGPAAGDRAFGQAELPLREVSRAGGYHRKEGSRLAALVRPEDYAEILPARIARRMSPPSRYAVVAARLALERAGLATETFDELSVVISTSFGPSSYTEELLQQIFHDSPAAASPFLFTEAVANAPAAQVALQLKALGPNLTITQREAGPLIALDHAVLDLHNHRARQVLVAAVDEMNPLLHAGLDRFGVLAGSRSLGRSREEVARPFDRRRNGFLAAEGATALLLEPLETILARGSQPIALVAAHAAAFDPSAEVAALGREPQPTGQVLRRQLERQGIQPGGIDAIVTAACGSRQGDAYEAQLLRSLWGDAPLPPLFAPKAYTGNHGGAQLAFACWLLEGGQPAATPFFAVADPRLDLSPYDGRPLKTPKRLLISAPAVGGAVALTVLDRWTSP